MATLPPIPPANPRLSNLAVGKVPHDLAFIDQLVPLTRTTVQVGRYLKYTLRDKLREDRIGPLTEWPTSRPAKGVEGTYICELHGHEHPVPLLQDGASYESDVQNAIFLGTRQVQFNKVAKWLLLLSEPTAYGNANTGAPTAKFSVDSTDIQDLFRGQRRVAGQGVYRNVAAMGYDVYQGILKNKTFRDSFKAVQLLPAGEDPKRGFVAEYLGLEQLFVLDLQYDQAADGQGEDYVDLWPAGCVAFWHRGPLMSSAGVPQLDDANRPLLAEMQTAFVRQMVWTGVKGAPDGLGVWTYDSRERGLGVTHVQCGQLYAEPELTQPELGWLWTDCI